MNVSTGVEELKAVRSRLPSDVGFVPTMGFLHEGHLSLVRRCLEENAAAVVSLFVNPAQFGPGEDYASYPRDAARDLALLEAEGVDLVFVPTEEALYGPNHRTWVDQPGLTDRLEGAARPGHFRGVLTVVLKLLHLAEPRRLYLGQKDAQQAVVLRRMVHDLNLPVEVIVGPTVREADGLAMSSRNSYLAPAERAAAPALFRALSAGRAVWERGERDAEGVRQAVRKVLAEEPLIAVDYVSVADAGSLDELSRIDRPALASLAVSIGTTRLIDNVLLGEETL